MSRRPLTLLFDASPLINGRLSGVGYYTKGVIEALATGYPDDELVGHYFNFLGKKDTSHLPRARNIRYVETRLLPGKALSLFRRFGLQIPFDLLIKTRGDAAFFPNFVSLPLLRRIPSLVAVPDLSFVDCPEYVQAKNRKFLLRFVPRSVRKAAAVFAISEATKLSLIGHYDLDENTISVAHIPVAVMPHGLPHPALVHGKYILFMSTLEPRKNFLTLVKAFCALSQELKEKYSLVLAGGEGWDVEADIAEVRRLQQTGEKIIMTGYVDEATRASLYEHASLFVMPSYYEGFGMPLLEAMSYGVPVLASDIPVFHEVAGDAAIFADPNSAYEFTAKLAAVLRSETDRKTLVHNGRSQVKKFSWTEVAESMHDTIIKTLKEEG
ncbi:glycosyltransferase family 1 protein [soil metagenome]